MNTTPLFERYKFPGSEKIPQELPKHLKPPTAQVILRNMDNSVVEVAVKGVMPTSSGCAVFLGNDDKTFVIYVDQGIGTSIQNAASDIRTERPMTHNLMVTLLDGLGAEVERVVINDVEDGTFFARLIISMENELGHKIIEVDARPSDSMVLALMSGKPLYAASKVIDAVDDMTEILAKILKEDQ